MTCIKTGHITTMEQQKARSQQRWFGHRAGRSPCAHSIGKFFPCYIPFFSSETSAPGSPGNYLYLRQICLPSKNSNSPSMRLPNDQDICPVAPLLKSAWQKSASLRDGMDCFEGRSWLILFDSALETSASGIIWSKEIGE